MDGVGFRMQLGALPRRARSLFISCMINQPNFSSEQLNRSRGQQRISHCREKEAILDQVGTFGPMS